MRPNNNIVDYNNNQQKFCGLFSNNKKVNKSIKDTLLQKMNEVF